MELVGECGSIFKNSFSSENVPSLPVTALLSSRPPPPVQANVSNPAWLFEAAFVVSVPFCQHCAVRFTSLFYSPFPAVRDWSSFYRGRAVRARV